MLKSRGPIIIVPGGLITKLHKHSRIKSEILFKICRTAPFLSTLFIVFFRRRYIAAGGETVAAAKAVIKGPCPRLISLRPLLRPCKGKRLHPLAIKAKGCTAQKKKKERQRKEKKKQRERGT
jgi:hypothetical protein